MPALKFPTDYPEDCPPDPWETLPGTYYRLVETVEGCNPGDFLSSNDRDIYPEDPECYRRCVSIYSSLSDVKRVRKAFKKLPRHIAQLDLRGDHGVLRSTPDEFDSHHDWWIASGVDPASFCVRIVE